jgi:hypothetical protein
MRLFSAPLRRGTFLMVVAFQLGLASIFSERLLNEGLSRLFV